MKVKHYPNLWKQIGFFLFSFSLRLFASMSPVIPLNFSPMESTALFSATIFKRKIFVIIIPLLLLFCTDFLIDYIKIGRFSAFYPGFYWQYFSYVFITFCGTRFLTKFTLSNVMATSIQSSILFFLISNFGVWATGTLYPMTLSGLTSCYFMALPFYQTALLGNVFFSMVFYVALRRSRSRGHHYRPVPKG